MLSHKCPFGVVYIVAEVSDGDPHTPIRVVVLFDMPMDTNRAHVLSALLHGNNTFNLWCNEWYS